MRIFAQKLHHTRKSDFTVKQLVAAVSVGQMDHLWLQATDHCPLQLSTTVQHWPERSLSATVISSSLKHLSICFDKLFF